MIPWEIRAREFANCNCSYGCPCQFNDLPTHGHCEAVVGMQIDKGHYGDVKLDGLRIASIFQWPGAVHEGRGRCQPVVDERADARQREALLKLMAGEDSDPFATVFSVMASTMEQVYEPVIRPIDFEVDVEARTGRLIVDGLIEMHGEPIRNKVTGAPSRARIDLPDGFEYTIAEIGSGSSTTRGKIGLSLKNTYGQFAHLHLNNHGVVRD